MTESCNSCLSNMKEDMQHALKYLEKEFEKIRAGKRM
jgi:ribosome recycling factor